MLDDADVVQHASVISERFDVARANVAKIPENPLTNNVLAVKPSPGLEVLKKILAELLGANSVERVAMVSTEL